MVNFMGAITTKFGFLTANLLHSGFHYGNLVTYMRLKNIIPQPASKALLNIKIYRVSENSGFLDSLQRLFWLNFTVSG
jgi:hypothetical protein